MKQLSGLDAFFLNGETPKQAMNLTGVGIYDPAGRAGGAPTFADCIAYARDRTQRSDLFRRKLTSLPLQADFPYWTEDPQFRADNHVFHCVLPKPGTREQLNAAIAKIHATVVCQTGPLWEWWFIEGIGGIEGIAPNSFAIAFKLHHAAFDGVSGWEVINVAHDTRPDCDVPKKDHNAPPADPPKSSVAEPGFSEMMMQSIGHAFSAPQRFAAALKDMATIGQKLRKGAASDFPLYGGIVPSSPFNKPLSTARAHDSIPVTLAQLKQIRALAPGSTVNDAVLAIIGGGIRRYLITRSALPARSLVVGVPISIRAPGDASAAGNQAILACLPIGSDLVDPIERLQRLHVATTAKKAFAQDAPAASMTQLMDFVPGMMQSAAVRAFTDFGMAHIASNMFNFIVTNVPASRVPIYFMGSKMVTYDASGPVFDGAGMIHAVTSYLDLLRISIDCDARLIPDVAVYRGCIEESLDEYLALSATP